MSMLAKAGTDIAAEKATAAKINFMRTPNEGACEYNRMLI
jgi:hypothetical protein